MSFWLGAQRALLLAAGHPQRVSGAIFIAPALPIAAAHPERTVHSFAEPLATGYDWAKYNAHHWRRNDRDFLELFFSQVFTEPHSTKQREDAVRWGLETDADTLIATQNAPSLETREQVLELCSRVRCPVLVIHGDEDAINPHARGLALAEATRGRLVTLAGSGHAPHARDPVKVNLLLLELIDALPRHPPPAPEHPIARHDRASGGRELNPSRQRARRGRTREHDRRSGLEGRCLPEPSAIGCGRQRASRRPAAICPLGTTSRRLA